MPTRKQRRRQAKSKRHEYEFVYVDDEGNEVEVPSEEAHDERRNGMKPKPSAAKKTVPQRGARARRAPSPPSWQRAGKRAALLGVVVLVLFSFSSKHNYAQAVVLAIIYTILFVPFTYAVDRFAYRRWQARQGQPPATKR